MRRLAASLPEQKCADQLCVDGKPIEPVKEKAIDSAARTAMNDLSAAVTVLQWRLQDFYQQAEGVLRQVSEDFKGVFADDFMGKGASVGSSSSVTRDRVLYDAERFYLYLKDKVSPFLDDVEECAETEQTRRDNANAWLEKYKNWYYEHKAWETRQDEASGFLDTLSEIGTLGAAKTATWNDPEPPQPDLSEVDFTSDDVPTLEGLTDDDEGLLDWDRKFDDGGWCTGRSSAVPENLRAWGVWLDDGTPDIDTAYKDFWTALEGGSFDGASRYIGDPAAGSWKWGRFDLSGLALAVDAFKTNNETLRSWLDGIAEAFDIADRNNLSDRELASYMGLGGPHDLRDYRADYIPVEVEDVQVTVQPSSGFAADPVNVASGALTEVESDFRFEGMASSLGLVRTFNAGDRVGGVFGTRWSSVLDERLVVPEGISESFDVEDEASHDVLWHKYTGESVFFRGVDVFGESIRGEDVSWWCQQVRVDECGLGSNASSYFGDLSSAWLWKISDNEGRARFFTSQGVLVGFVDGDVSSLVVCVRDSEGKIASLGHVLSGRSLSVEYTGEGLVSHVRANDEECLSYRYEDGCLTSVSNAYGERCYSWEDGRLVRIVDEHGDVLMETAYDEYGRAIRQKVLSGRDIEFKYLPTGATVVQDAEAGEFPDHDQDRRTDIWVSDQSSYLVGVCDSHGEAMSISRDRFGNPVSIIDREGKETLKVFDERSRLSLTVSPEGVRTSMEWDEWDRPTRITREIPQLFDSPDNDSDALVEEIVVVYSDPEDTHGLVVRTPVSVTDSEGVTYSFEHDEAGRITAMCGAGGYRLAFSYDENTSDLASITNALGHVVSFTYDEAGRMTSHSTPSGATTTFTYNVAGDITKRVEPDGAVYEYTYEHGRLMSETAPDGGTTVYTYGSNGEVESVTDPLGRVTSFTHDDQGNTASVTTPGGDTWATVHDSMSRLTKILTPAGEEWAYGYTANGKLESVTSPTGTITNIAKTLFDGGTQLSATTSSQTEDVTSPIPTPAMDPSPAVSTSTGQQQSQSSGLVLDAAGRPVQTTSPDGSVLETRVYDNAGRLSEVLDSEAGLTRYEYNELGLVSRIIAPDESVTGFVYDKGARLVQRTYESEIVNEYEYDADGRVTRVVNQDGSEQVFTYDACGRLLSRSTPEDGTTTYTYDVCGRVASVTDGLHGTRGFSYDAAGQLISATDANGNATTYTYTPAGHVETMTAPDGGVTHYEYDCYGNTTRVTDSLGRSETRTYDASGNLTGLTRADKTGLSYDYDGGGRLLGVENHKGETLASYDYDNVARTVSVTDSLAGTEHRLVFDRLGRLTQKTTGDATIAYAYNMAGERESVTITRDGQETPTVIAYAYGSTGQLEEVTHSTFGTITASSSQASNASNEAISIERDETGHISRIVTSDSDVSYGYDTAGQLASLTDNATGETSAYAYDACGRIATITTSEGQTSFAYNVAGELTSRTLPSGTVVAYAYDSCGRRVSETRDGVLVASYEWDNLGYLARVTASSSRESDTSEAISLSHDVFGNLNGVTIGEETTSFVWDTNSGIPSLLQAGNTDVFTALGHTAHGTTGDNTGWLSHGWRGVRSTNPANPWALPSFIPQGSTPAPWNILLGGSVSVSGLELMGARTYDPATHSFLTRDPLLPVLGTPYANNPYEYAGNNPLALLDPLGLRAITDEQMEGLANNYNAAVAEHNANLTKNGWDIAGEWLTEGAGAWIVGGVAFAVGAVLTFVPPLNAVAPLGMGLMSFGGDVLLQKATTGTVDYTDAAISGVLGAAGGPLSIAGKFGKLKTLASIGEYGGKSFRQLSKLQKVGRIASNGARASFDAGVTSFTQETVNLGQKAADGKLTWEDVKSSGAKVATNTAVGVFSGGGKAPKTFDYNPATGSYHPKNGGYDHVDDLKHGMRGENNLNKLEKQVTDADSDRIVKEAAMNTKSSEYAEAVSAENRAANYEAKTQQAYDTARAATADADNEMHRNILRNEESFAKENYEQASKAHTDAVENRVDKQAAYENAKAEHDAASKQSNDAAQRYQDAETRAEQRLEAGKSELNKFAKNATNKVVVPSVDEAISGDDERPGWRKAAEKVVVNQVFNAPSYVK